MVDIAAFVRDGFSKLEGAVPRHVADAARARLWQQIGLPPNEPDTWKEPVVWAADLTGEGPFGEIVSSPQLAGALDKVCGEGGWSPRGALGNIPIRFPVRPPADDRGWHIDSNTPLPDGNWVVSGRPHTMLLLVVLSHIGPLDAATRIRVGSHREVSAVLGEKTLDFRQSGPLVDAVSTHCKMARVTGDPGDMYLVHPFTVHAADEHRGTAPRFMSQAPVLLAQPLSPHSTSVLGCVWER